MLNGRRYLGKNGHSGVVVMTSLSKFVVPGLVEQTISEQDQRQEGRVQQEDWVQQDSDQVRYDSLSLPSSTSSQLFRSVLVYRGESTGSRGARVFLVQPDLNPYIQL